MANELTKELFIKMLSRARAKIEENFDYLNELDSATGDGDHGTAILSTMKAAVEATKEEATFTALLNNVGWGIMKATGGSTSSLTGAFYLGMGNVVQDETLSPEKTVKAFEAALKNTASMTPAKAGDKTMMDAIIPAVEAMRKQITDNPESTLAEIFAAAAQAAREGAEATKEMTAKQGRAKNLGPRSVGHIDAGATSFALIMTAFAETLEAAAEKAE